MAPARSHQLQPLLCSLLPTDQLEALSEPGHCHGVISSQRRGEVDLQHSVLLCSPSKPCKQP